MNQKIRDILGAVLVGSLVLVSVAIGFYVYAYSRSTEPTSFRSFTVSGNGKIVAVPDVAEFSFSVITEGGTDIATLQKTNTEKINAAIKFVKEKGTKEKDIKTEGYNISPRYQYSNCIGGQVCPPPEISGYSVQQSVLVKVRDFGMAGDIIAGVVKNGANSVSQLSFTIDDKTAVENEARAEAIDKAKVKAKILAKVGGFRLGRLLSIEEVGTPSDPSPYYAYGMGGGNEMMKNVAAPAPVIEPGSQEVNITMNLQYEIR